jgi:putative tricarboxylic transport membrane protein
MSLQRPNLLAALAGIALSLAYIWQARSIEDSLLADEVGAGGVPTGVGLVLLAASLGLFIKSLLSWFKAAPGEPELVQEPAQTEDHAPHPHRKAFGLLAILGCYVALLPWLGYVVAIGLLAVAVVRFDGVRINRTLLVFALAIGPILWFVFSYLLQVRMPAGLWSSLLGA